VAISAEAAVTDAARTAAPPGALGVGFDVGCARGHVRPLIGTNHFAQTASKFDDIARAMLGPAATLPGARK